MNQPHSIVFRRDLAQREARFGASVARSLNASAEALPHDLSERLRVAREQAVAVARQKRSAVAASPSVVSSGPVAVLGLPGRAGGFFSRLMALLPAVVLIAGLAAIQQWHTHTQAKATADVDAALLADTVPPSAYDDPGFVEYLKAPQE